jgi:hypothetical protein
MGLESVFTQIDQKSVSPFVFLFWLFWGKKDKVFCNPQKDQKKSQQKTLFCSFFLCSTQKPQKFWSNLKNFMG